MTRPIDTVIADIRAAEREAARRLDEAHRRADERMEAAEDTSRQLLEEARQRGDARAEQRHDDALRDAGKTAAQLRAVAATRAEELRSTARPHLGRIAAAMVDFVLCTAGEEA